MKTIFKSGLSIGICIVFGTALLSRSVSAQEPSPGYSDEEAAGVNYSDVEAAGSTPVVSPDDTAPTTDTAAVVTTSEVVAAPGAEVADGAPKRSKTPVKVSDPDRHARPMWEWGADRHHMSRSGSSGLLDIKEAGSGPVGTFGLGLTGSYSRYTDYLIANDENTSMSGELLLRVTPLKFLEIYGGILVSANSNNKEHPVLFQTIGDIHLGFKGFFSPVGPLTLGLDASVYLLNSVGDVSIDWSGTSVGMDALASLDFAEINESVPLRLNFEVGYYFDNSGHLVEDIEYADGGCGTDLDNDGQVEYQGCLSPVERTALSIDRTDHINLGLGIDASLPYVSPIVEYSMEIPVNRQGFTCPQSVPGSYDSCLANEGGRGMRQYLNLGVRILPPVRDLAVDLGVQIGLAGYAPSVHELAAQTPWALLLGLNYSIDPTPPKPKCEALAVLPPPVIPPVAPPPAIVVGTVVAEGTDTPVDGAVVVYDGLQLNSQNTSADGRFNSYPLTEGQVTFRISAAGYAEGLFTVQVPASGFLEQRFSLAPLARKGVVTLKLIDENGVALPGIAVQVSGVFSGTFTSDAEGKAMFESDIGRVEFAVDAPDRMPKRSAADVAVDTRTMVEIVLSPKPKTSSVTIKAKQIKIRGKILFKTDSDVIDEKSFGLLDEVASTMISNPELARVEIQGHTDDRGKADYNTELSERRAKSVKDYLVKAGVAEGRLSYKGFGPSRSIAPNFTSSGRAMNRRVEFHILERTGAASDN